MTGIKAFLSLLADYGAAYIFGNPGTTELPLNDALHDEPRLKYILGLQEVPVMAIADGYAMASQQLGIVNLHISCGLGNAMGMLYNAYREGTPLLVTAGQQNRRFVFEEPILWSDLVRVAEPWTKWAMEVSRVEDLPSATRRAIQLALTPPTGPVFLSLPVDVQMEESAELDLAQPKLPDCQIRPPLEAVQAAARVLCEAKNPAILVGSRVQERNAVPELIAVAELLGTPVISESGVTHGRLGFPCDHPLYGQGLPLWSPEVRDRLWEFDVLLVVGMDLLRQYVYHEPARALPEHLRIVHMDEDPYQLGKNYPLEVGVIGNTKASLIELADQLNEQLSETEKEIVRQRAERWSGTHRRRHEQLVEEAESQASIRPMSPLAAMHALSNVLPPNIAVVEEAVTTTNLAFERFGALKNTSGYFGQRGWGLGWGLGCAIGVKLAWPDRPVLALLGEGSAMYGIQGLWTAARYRIPVTFVVFNNAQYQILKFGAKGLGLPYAGQKKFIGLDLVDPEIDFVSLSESLGVPACRVDGPDELADAVRHSWNQNVPRLIDAPIARR